MSPLTIILIVLVLVAAAFILYYNKFVRMRNMVDNAWAQVDVQLQRRADLIPNLVETVKGYMAHEQGTLDSITQARAAVADAKTPEERMAAENALSATLGKLFAVAEQYPDLKASESFVNLQKQLAETEDKVSYMRQSFNDTVMKYNTAIQQFPGTLFSGLFGFERRNSFDADLDAEAAPVVGFTPQPDAPASEEQ
ncbi:MAG: LemA family protein [Eggerthellaceae bacterium]|nr:LemA family protein [Eggerthellaceae bacterium]